VLIVNINLLKMKLDQDDLIKIVYEQIEELDKEKKDHYENNKKLSVTYKKDYMTKQMLYYDFSKELPSNLDVSGLSGIEDWGRWSDGPVVEFKFYYLPMNKEEDLILKFYIRPFVYHLRQYQTVKIFVNDKHMDTWKYKFGQSFPNTILEIPRQMLNNKEDIFLKIKFEIENPVSPIELNYNEDERKIGIGFMNISIDKKIRDYDFSKELPSNLVVSGLSGIEHWGRWSDSSVVEFELSNLPINDLILKFDTIAYLTNKQQNQIVSVFINYVKYKTWNYKENQVLPNTTLKIPQQILNENKGHLYIRFEFENQIFSPFELGHSFDTRRLGIGFKKLIITEINDPYAKIIQK